MAFLSTRDVLEALVGRLEEVKFPADLVDDDSNASELAGELIFEKVTMSDTPSLGLVLNRLIAVTERIAAVVPGVEQYREDGTTGRVQRYQRFTLMFSTQDFSPFEDPAFFSETGLIAINEMVVREMMKPFGEARTPLRMARIRPLRGGSQIVKSEESEDSAREVYFLELEATMGAAKVC